jgi:hypothetical protein
MGHSLAGGAAAEDDGAMAQDGAAAPPAARISAREADVLAAVAEHLTNAEIAARGILLAVGAGRSARQPPASPDDGGLPSVLSTESGRWWDP